MFLLSFFFGDDRTGQIGQTVQWNPDPLFYLKIAKISSSMTLVSSNVEQN